MKKNYEVKIGWEGSEEYEVETVEVDLDNVDEHCDLEEEVRRVLSKFMVCPDFIHDIREV